MLFWQVWYREYYDMYDLEDIMTPFFDMYEMDSEILFWHVWYGEYSDTLLRHATHVHERMVFGI